MHSIKINKKKYSIPSEWGELTAQQVRKLAYVRGEGFQRNLQALFLISSNQLKKALGRIDPAKVSSIADCLDWVQDRRKVEEPDEEVEPLIPSFRHNFTTYYFPQKSLNDINVNEWMWIDVYINEINDNPQNAGDSLHGLLATICRPLRPKSERKSADYDGYPRQKFNPELIPDLERKLKGVPGWVYYVLDDYISRAQQMLKARYGVVFEGESSDGPNWGWKGSVMNVAESGTYGPEQSVLNENIHNFCLYLTKKILDDRAFKERMKNLKNAKS